MMIMLSAHKTQFKIILLKYTASLPGGLPLSPPSQDSRAQQAFPLTHPSDWQSQDRWWSHHWGGVRPEQGWSPAGGRLFLSWPLEGGEAESPHFKKTFAPSIG